MSVNTSKTEVRAPMSLGDILDRCTINTIKLNKFNCDIKRESVLKELDQLKRCWDDGGFESMETLVEWDSLIQINTGLWETEDALRELEKLGDFGELFIRLARSVYKLNDQRSQVKKQLNLRLGSEIIEEKQYAEEDALSLDLRFVGNDLELPGQSAELVSETNIVEGAVADLKMYGACVVPLSSIDTPPSLQKLITECNELPILLDDGLEPGVIRAGPYHFVEAVRNLVGDQLFLQIASQILPNGPRLDTVMFRRPFKNFGQQRLHRDPPFPALSFLLNLTPVDRLNGATRFVKGSHHLSEDMEGLLEEERQITWIESEEPVVAIIDNRTFHAGSRNLSGSDRPLLYWIYRDLAAEIGGSVYQEASEQQLANRTKRETDILRGITNTHILKGQK